MRIKRKDHRDMARRMARLDINELKLVRERGGDIFRLKSAQMKALQTHVALWPEDEKLIFIKRYSEEVLMLENKCSCPAKGCSPACRNRYLVRALIGVALLLLTLFLVFCAN